MQEADQSCVCLGSLPVVHEVLERCKELHDATFDLRSNLVLLSEEKDEVLLHGQITGVDCTIDLITGPIMSTAMNKQNPTTSFELHVVAPNQNIHEP